MSERYDPFYTGPLLLDHREPWSQTFEREAPLEVEIGFGYGHFLLEYGRARPELNVVGIEFRPKLAYQVADRIARQGRTNLMALRGDAKRHLPTLFAPGSVQAFHVQFPDPWWKKRHHKRRLVDTELATLFHTLLRPKGRVYLRTDVLDYGRAMIETFEAGAPPFLNLEGPRAFTADDGLGVPSNRERRYLANGTPVYRLVYERGE